jgi:2-dehydropantoate 2-reductase
MNPRDLPPNPKFAVVGAGAIGGYYGGRLAQHGRDVHFLMRGDLAAVRKNGLTLRSGDEVVRIENVNAHAATSDIGPSDVVIVALKTTSNLDLEKLIPPLLHDGTVLLTLQNGLGNEEFLAGRFGAERVIGGLCFVCLNRVGPGVVEHYGHGTLSIGEFERAPLPRTRAVVRKFQQAGIEARLVEDLITERWRKLVWNVPFNGLSIAAGSITVADILADEGLHKLTRDLMAEVIGAAARLGHAIPMSFIDEQIQRSLVMGPYKPSSLIDYDAGRTVEVESIWGEPWRQAVREGAEVTRLEMLYFLLKRLTSDAGS